MKVLLNYGMAITIGLLLLANPIARAADSRVAVDEVRQVSANERVTIEVMSGDVTIRAGTDNTFTVTGLLDEQAEGFSLTSANGFTRFEVEMPRATRFSGFRNGRNGSDLEFVIPVNSTVEFSGVNASVDISGIQGGAIVNTVNGPVRARQLATHVELKTVNGAIDSSGLSGRIEITTVNGSIDDTGSTGRARYQAVNGHINVDSAADEVSLSVVNGRVTARLQQAGIVELNSVNGPMDLTLLGSLTPRITGNSVSGNMTLNLDSSINARFSVRNNVGGSITNRLTSDEVVRATHGPARRLEFTTADGEGTVDLTTLNGRVELNRN